MAKSAKKRPNAKGAPKSPVPAKKTARKTPAKRRAANCDGPRKPIPVLSARTADEQVRDLTASAMSSVHLGASVHPRLTVEEQFDAAREAGCDLPRQRRHSDRLAAFAIGLALVVLACVVVVVAQ